MNNARFWVFHKDDWVKLTVTPEKPVEHASYSRDEEGYTLERDRYELEAGSVIHHWLIEGRDCDGRMKRFGTSACPIADLQAVKSQDDAPARPKWNEVRRGQRDFTAEAAGF